MLRIRPVTLVALCASLVACGEVEEKPNEPVANLATNNTSANNVFANNVSNTCLLDTDCVAGEVCELEACVATCTSDADCLADELCRPRVNGQGTTCQVGNSNNASLGCDAQRDPNAFCEALAGVGAFCDTASGDCVGDTEPSIFIAQIQDVTSRTDLCEGTNDPGSDIQGVELLDEFGNSIGWGSLVAENVVLDGNIQANFEVIDGTPPALDGDGCVDSFSGNVLALGCVGSIAVEFLDESANPVALQDGFSISVYEYGEVCSTGVEGDEYTVSTCSDTAGARNGDEGSCSNVLGSGEGLSTFTVNL